MLNGCNIKYFRRKPKRRITAGSGVSSVEAYRIGEYFLNVKLQVYNVLGQDVVTLIDGEQPASYKNITWNGSTFASGIYFHRLEGISVAKPTKAFRQIKNDSDGIGQRTRHTVICIKDLHKKRDNPPRG